MELERSGIAAWQYNNAAKHAIEYFYKKTDYERRIIKLNLMAYGSGKIAYLRQTKDLVRENWSILEEADDYLKKAARLNRKAPDSRRTSVIKSNRRFITQMRNFM